MSNADIPLDVAAAQEHLMRFLAVPGVTGHEAEIADAVSAALKAIGVPASAIRYRRCEYPYSPAHARRAT